MRGWMTIACFWLLIAGCDRTEKTPSEEASVKVQQAATVLSERGPVSVSVSVIPEKPRLSDEPELTLTVRAEAGVDVSLPEFGESVGDFLIRDFHEPIPRTEEGSQILQQVYTLEPETAGRVVIDPFVVSFTDNRKEGDGKEHSVETEPLPKGTLCLADPGFFSRRVPPEEVANRKMACTLSGGMHVSGWARTNCSRSEALSPAGARLVSTVESAPSRHRPHVCPSIDMHPSGGYGLAKRPICGMMAPTKWRKRYARLGRYPPCPGRSGADTAPLPAPLERRSRPSGLV